MRVERFTTADLLPLQALVNRHLGAVVPGWALSATDLARHLERDETEYIVDPWVAERATLCVRDSHRVLAAAHLLRYDDRPTVGEWYRGAGEIGWALGLPDAPDALAATVAAARDQFRRWGMAREWGWGAGLPAGPFGGVPDTWPHVAAALETVGYRPGAEGRELLYGGTLDGVPAPGAPPLPGLTLQRAVGAWGVRFAAVLDAEEIGHCDGSPDLTHGGALPGPRGWADLGDLWVREDRRGQGIGRWLVAHFAAWLRLGGANRIVLSVAAEDEPAGVGRFYQRFGWQPLVRAIRLWPHESSPTL